MAKKNMWEWVQRIATVSGIVMGVTAFVWQIQERRDAGRESFTTMISGVARVQDSLFVVSIDVLNTGRRPASIRDVRLWRTLAGARWNSVFLQADSTGEAANLDPDHSRTFRSRPVTLADISSFTDSLIIDVRTLRGTYTTPVSPRAFSLAVADGDDASRARTTLQVVTDSGHSITVMAARAGSKADSTWIKLSQP